jgi:hypothetical protein
MSQVFYRRSLPLAIAAIAGIIVTLHYFVSPISELDTAKNTILTWSSLAAAFGILVGAVGTLWLHTSRMKSTTVKTKTRVLSGLTIAVTLLFIVVGASFEGFTGSSEYVSISNHILAALSKSVRAVAFFSCLFGAYRAFRVDNIDSLLMFGSACIYLLRSFAAGVFLIPSVVTVGDWLANVPNVGATRGALIAAAVAALILAVRVFTGKERSVAEVVGEAEGA